VYNKDKYMHSDLMEQQLTLKEDKIDI